MKRKVFAAWGAHGPGLPKKQVLSGKNVPGTVVKPSCVPSIPVEVSGASGLLKSGRLLGRPLPWLAKPSKGVSGLPLSSVAMPDHCQRSVNAFSTQFDLARGKAYTYDNTNR